MLSSRPRTITRLPYTPGFTSEVSSQIDEAFPDRRGYPLCIRRLDAATAHREKVVTYERRANGLTGHDDVYAILRWPEIGDAPIEVGPDRQHILTYATFKDLDSAISDTANSPTLSSGRSLREAFDGERDRVASLARAARSAGRVEPDYGTYAWDPLEQRLYLLAPEFWHRLGLRVSNGMIHRDPKRVLSWSEIDRRLYEYVVGFVGLSVGGNMVEGWMRDSAWARTWKGADYDRIEIKNLTRLSRCSLRHVMGPRSMRADQLDPFDLPRTITKADQLAHSHQMVNPYQDAFIYPGGLTEDTLETFLLGDGADEPGLDMFVEVVDSLAFKVHSREVCRARGIPVLMAGDCGKIALVGFQDYRRYPNLGLGYASDEEMRASVDEVMRSGQITDFVRFEEALSGPEVVRDVGYMDWVHGRGEQPVSSIPQLGTTALLNGITGAMIAAYALGHEIPEMVAIDTETYEIRVSRWPR